MIWLRYSMEPRVNLSYCCRCHISQSPMIYQTSGYPFIIMSTCCDRVIVWSKNMPRLRMVLEMGMEWEPILSEMSGNLLMLHHEPAMKNSVLKSSNFRELSESHFLISEIGDLNAVSLARVFSKSPGTCGSKQGLRASSLQFTSPLEFNAIFRDGFPLRLDLTAGSKIRDPVTAKFKHAQSL